MLMCCVVTDSTTMPEIASTEVDSIPGEQKMNICFFPINNSISY